ncbi:thiol-activated cytolysin family protein [Pedobacter sp. NJ-S-72]
MIKFTQKNFSLLMDTPEPGELYTNLNINALGGIWPTYISSITYGSIGVLAIESDESSETIKSTYEKAFNVLGGLVSGGSNLTSAEQGVINNSSMKIYFVGVNGAEAVKSIFSYDELSAYIKRGSTFAPQTPGVPISFKMNVLPDNKPLKNKL